MRTSLALLAAALVAGCGTCDDREELERARQGDVAAIQQTGELGDPRIPASAALVDPRIDEAIAAVASHLDSADPFIRLQALESVRRLAQRARDVYRNRFPTLFDRLLSDPEAEVRWRAAWALGRIERTSPELRGAALDPHPLVAERAVWALGQARDDAAVDVLVTTLDRDDAVAAQAAASLARITGLRHPDVAGWRAWGRQWRARRSD
jgi:HEAT repeat protein